MPPTILLAFSPETSDALTLWGFVVGVVGLVVGVVGFGYTIYQVWKVKAAAEAAKEAAEKTLAESREAYEKLAGAFASRLLSDLEDAVNSKDWALATIRAKDVAELVSTASQSIPDTVELA
ncbi:MAG: hypothetical protein L0241_32280, partial [Planctomycetia bacterium]|nr:hypothetical protein [Planctomycetia bacterium]